MKNYDLFPQHSAEYVVLHAAHAKKRGKNPSASFLGKKNPREALESASYIIGYFPITNNRHLSLDRVTKLFDTIRLLEFAISTVIIMPGKYRDFLWRHYPSKGNILPWFYRPGKWSSPLVYKRDNNGLQIVVSLYTPLEMLHENVLMAVPCFVCGETKKDLSMESGFIEALFMIDPITGVEKGARLVIKGTLVNPIMRLDSIDKDFKNTGVHNCSWNEAMQHIITFHSELEEIYFDM